MLRKSAFTNRKNVGQLNEVGHDLGQESAEVQCKADLSRMASETPGPGNDLDDRLSKLGNKLDQHRVDSDGADGGKGLQDNRGMAFGMKIASEFVSAVIVGAALGWVFDYWVGTAPFGLIVLLMLGFAAGVINVMRATGQMAERQ